MSKHIRRFFLCLLFIIIIVGCSGEKETGLISNDYEKLIITNRSSPINAIYLYNDEQKPEIFKWNSEYELESFELIGDTIYLYGSGLYSLNLDNITFESISNKNIDAIAVDDESIYMYENVRSEDKVIKGIIYKDDEVLFEIDKTVYDMEVYNGLLYFIVDGYDFTNRKVGYFDGKEIHYFSNNVWIDDLVVIDNTLCVFSDYYYGYLEEDHIRGFEVDDYSIYTYNYVYPYEDRAFLCGVDRNRESSAVFEISVDGNKLIMNKVVGFDGGGSFINDLYNHNIIFYDFDGYTAYNIDTSELTPIDTDIKYINYLSVTNNK